MLQPLSAVCGGHQLHLNPCLGQLLACAPLCLSPPHCWCLSHPKSQSDQTRMNQGSRGQAEVGERLGRSLPSHCWSCCPCAML